MYCMRVCGVELKANDAVICLLSMEDGIFDIPDCRVRKVSLEKTQSLKFFQSTFAKLMSDYHIEKVIIRERPTAGKFSGAAIGFKLEAAIQLIDGLDVELITPVDIKVYIKKNPIPVAFDDTGLKIFQEAAFTTAYAYIMHAHYNDPNDE
jgi:hypothetical protein